MTWLGVARLRNTAAASSDWLVAPWALAYGFSSHDVIYEPAFVLGLGIAVPSLPARVAFRGTRARQSMVLVVPSSSRAKGLEQVRPARSRSRHPAAGSVHTVAGR